MKKNSKKTLLTTLLTTLFLTMLFVIGGGENAKAANITAPGPGNEYAYFFKDGTYVMYDLVKERQLDGYPLPVKGNWPGVPWTNIDAAFTNPAEKTKGYIFKGNEYIRYDYTRDRADEGYPHKITNSSWKGLPFDSVDAAIPSNNGKVFFVKGNQYARFDMYNDRCDAGYPRTFNSSSWPGVPWTSIDSAVTKSNNICYLFKGNEYIRYDMNADRAVSGVMKISGNWANLSYTNNIKGALLVGKPTNENLQQKIVAEARKQLGKPYQWGATGPNSFDCSGLTQYVYRQAVGINIGRTTYDQIKDGREVSQSQLQPGDLVFTSPDHVGIYIGNGQMIHAPKPGDVVKISSVYKFWRARRII